VSRTTHVCGCALCTTLLCKRLFPSRLVKSKVIFLSFFFFWGGGGLKHPDPLQLRGIGEEPVLYTQEYFCNFT
jgi:hypothetical protein